MQLIFPPLIKREQIQQKVSQLAKEICDDMEVENLHVIVVLKGAVFFASDLLREFPPIASLDFIKAESYYGCSSRGKITISNYNFHDVKGKHVLIIEDILDTGLTTQKILEELKKQNPESIFLCVLLEKKKYRPKVAISADYVGFYIEDNFVVGYGMDYNGKFRNLPDIYILDFK